MSRIRITQVRSTIKRPKRQKLTMEALGLRRMHSTVEHTRTPQIEGMVRVVHNLVQVQTIA